MSDPDVQARLRALWTDVLGVDPGLDTDFFDLGGESLHLVRLTAEVRDAFHVALPLAELFADDLTVRARAAAVGREVLAARGSR